MYFDKEEFKKNIGECYSGGGYLPEWPADTLLELIMAVAWTIAFGWLLFPIFALGALKLK